MRIRIGRTLVISALSVGAIIGWACYGDIIGSVHFYSGDSYYQGEGNPRQVDFGRLPQRTMIPTWNNEMQRATWRSDWEEQIDSSGYADLDEPNEEVEAPIREKARNAEVSGNYRKALSIYRSLNMADATTRAFVQDRAQVFAACGDRRDAALKTYLTARYQLDFAGKEKHPAALQALQAIEGDRRLRPFVAYTLAATKGEGFLAIWEDFPDSPKAEAAMLMEVQRLIGSKNLGDIPTKDAAQKAKSLLAAFQTTYPRSTLRFRALGWLGRAEYLLGNMAGSMDAYGRQMAIASSPADRWKVYQSQAAVFGSFGAADKRVTTLFRQWLLPVGELKHAESGRQLRQLFTNLTAPRASAVREAIKRDPDLLQAYIGFRIEDTKIGLPEERELVAFASDALKAMPKPPAGLLSRVAQVSYNAGDYRRARDLAQRGVSAVGPVEYQERSRYTLAASLARLGKPKEAIAQYTRVCASKAPEYLKKTAVEPLAILEEHYGRPAKALALFQRVGYEYDVAFLADALLTPGQLKSYVESLPNSENRLVLTYTLGMRYLRQGKYAESRAVFKTLTKSQRLSYGLDPKKAAELESNLYFDKLASSDPLTRVDELEGLQKVIDRAKTAEEKAKATYAMASYIYKRRNLYYYSPGLWNGERAFTISIFWSGTMNGGAEDDALERHAYEHECLAHTKALCETIITKYPRSSVYTKALYTAALSGERLGNMNDWWRSHRNPLLMKSIHYLDQIKIKFPKDPLAQSAAKYSREFTGMMSPEF